MYSDQRLGTVRRDARVGLSVPMGASAQQGLMARRMVAPNVRGMNARRSINSVPGALPMAGVPGAMGAGGVRPPMAPPVQGPPPMARPPLQGVGPGMAAAPPPGAQGSPAVPLQLMLAQIGQALMAGQKGR